MTQAQGSLLPMDAAPAPEAALPAVETEAPARFVHLRCHSEYSLSDGLASVTRLVAAARGQQMQALALTDRNNLFGAVKFYRACMAAGVKPILGVDLECHSEALDADFRLTLLARNHAGYGNLIELVSLAYAVQDEGGRGGRLDPACLQTHGAGLIGISGGPDTEIGQALIHGDDALAEAAASRLAEWLPDCFYLEALRTGRRQEASCLPGVVALAERLQLPLVASNEVCFLEPEEFEAHETRACIQHHEVIDDPSRPRRYSQEQYMKSPEAMAEVFADLPEAIANSAEIARRCTLEMRLGEPHLPNYPVPEGLSLAQYLAQEARQGLQRRLAESGAASGQPPQENTYTERLEYELKVIEETGYPGYFLVVMEFIAWARSASIPVGPGRGSGAGSLVAYALGITDLDPVQHDLLFERFLNPDRVSMPDFDVDFCVEGRDRVIQHVVERYGEAAVGQIATFGAMKAKAVVRDVARAQGKPYAVGDRLARLIPAALDITLDKAERQEPELRSYLQTDESAQEVMAMAKQLEGVVRNVGRHAGGVVIAPTRLTDFVPLYRDRASAGLISQYDKDDAELAGLVKFDFLGLDTLTVIDWTVSAINQRHEAAGRAERVRIEQLPMDDAKAFDLLKRAETTGIFQLESRGMKELIRRLLPDTLDDVIALVALYRPGPLKSGAAENYIERKHGRQKVTYVDPRLEPVLANTFGVVIYQEQVMEISRVLAGFTRAQADVLRKAMGKKDPQEMANARDGFVRGAVAGGMDEAVATNLFSDLEDFAGYAFNKSHSAAYGLVAYQTAWLKANYPAEFMAALLSARMSDKDKVATLVAEARRMRLRLQPPSIGRSGFRFTGCDNEIIYGLGGVQNMGGGSAVESLCAAREAKPFASLADFCQRVDTRRVSRRLIEALIYSGAMDELGASDATPPTIRGQLLDQLDTALQAAGQASRDRANGIGDMFGGLAPATEALASTGRALRYTDCMEREREVLGFYLSGHPINPYLGEFTQLCKRLSAVRPDERRQRLFGFVDTLRTFPSRGGSMGVVEVDDGTQHMDAVLYSKVLEREKSKLEEGAIRVFEGLVQADERNGGCKLLVDRVLTLDEWRDFYLKELRIDAGVCRTPKLAEQMSDLLAPYRTATGGCRVRVVFQAESFAATLELGWRLRVRDLLLEQLRERFGQDGISLRFRAG